MKKLFRFGLCFTLLMQTAGFASVYAEESEKDDNILSFGARLVNQKEGIFPGGDESLEDDLDDENGGTLGGGCSVAIDNITDHFNNANLINARGKGQYQIGGELDLSNIEISFTESAVKGFENVGMKMTIEPTVKLDDAHFKTEKYHGQSAAINGYVADFAYDFDRYIYPGFLLVKVIDNPAETPEDVEDLSEFNVTLRVEAFEKGCAVESHDHNYDNHSFPFEIEVPVAVVSETLDYTSLSTLIEIIDDELNLNPIDYTDEFWQTFENAYNEAKDLLDKQSAQSQQEIEDMADSLANLIGELDNNEADTTTIREELKEKAATAKLIEQMDYVDSEDAAKWNELQNAIESAKNPATTMLKSQILEIMGRLDKAVEAFQAVPAATTEVKAELDDAIEAVAGIPEGDYTEATYTVLQNAINAARAVYENDKALKSQVLHALEQLSVAEGELVVANTDAAKAELDTILQDLDDLHADDYNSDTWQKLQETINEVYIAKEQFDEKTVNSQIKALTAKLNDAKAGLKPVAGSTVALEEAIEAADELLEKNYESANWEAFQTALGEAKELLKNKPTSSQIIAAVDKLNDAKDALTQKDADKGPLATAIAAAEKELEKVQDDYTADSWKALTDALAAANAVNEKEKPFVSEVDDAITALTDAKLVAKTANKTALNEKINEVKDYKEADYEAGWTEFSEALAAAQATSSDTNALQSTVNQALATLNDAIGKLKPVTITVDKGELSKAIEAAGKLNKEDYMEEYWNTFAEVLNEARNVFANADADEAAVEKATNDLNTAIEEVKKHPVPSVPTVDKAELQTAIEKAKEVDKENYTETSYAEFEKVVKAAEDVFNDSAADQDAVNKAVADLTAAYDLLKEKEVETPETVDKAVLDAKIKEVSNLKQEDYTPESWAVFALALEESNVVMADDNATQVTVNAALKNLIDAKDALVKKQVDTEDPDINKPSNPTTPEDPKPEQPVEPEKPTNPENPTKPSQGVSADKNPDGTLKNTSADENMQWYAFLLLSFIFTSFAFTMRLEKKENN